MPRERAGMATGIFSTVRMAGEGITVATAAGVFVSLRAGADMPHA